MEVNVKMSEKEFLEYMDYKNKKWEYEKNLSILVNEFTMTFIRNKKDLITMEMFNNFVRMVRDLGTKCFEVRK